MKAFPITNETGLKQQGMDLRDYFAAKVLQALESRSKFDGVTAKGVAIRCYQIADEMMKARNA